MTSECSCDKCVNACHTKPGWFLPGEAETAAQLLDLTLEEFFAQYLGADYWVEDSGGETFTLAPATALGTPGEVYPYIATGTCRLLGGGNRCLIYNARPHECREYIHTDGREEVDTRHRAVRDAWESEQDQIEQLLAAKV